VRTFGKPDPDCQNADRAKWAQVAVDAFQDETGTDDGDRLKDLLCDLMHWCDREKQDFSVALDAAQHHYTDETLKEG
jgi:hypothetical protein